MSLTTLRLQVAAALALIVLVTQAAPVAAQIFGPLATLNHNAASDSGDDSGVDLATDGLGNWLAVWSSKDDLGGTVGTDADIFVARSTDGGESWSPAQALNDNAFTDSLEDLHPQIATDGAGTWVVVWHASGIQVSRSTSGGVNWTSPTPLGGPGIQKNPDVAADGAGNWVVVFEEGASPDIDPWVSRSSDGGVTWSAPAIIDPLLDTSDDDQVNQQELSISVGGGTSWVVVLSHFGLAQGTLVAAIGIYRSWDGGVTWWSTAVGFTWPSPDSVIDRHPSVATDGNGTWLLVWSRLLDITAGPEEIAFAVSTDDGLSWVPGSFPGGLLGADSSEPAIAYGDGTWTVTWSNRLLTSPWTDVRAATSTDAGGSWQAVSVGSGPSGDDRDPAIATDGFGGWVIAWESESSLSGTIGTDLDILTVTTEIDTDDDGLTDNDENLIHGTDPNLADTDGDLVSDGAEVNWFGTAPLLSDSDGDAQSDAVELAAGSDPDDGLSTPAAAFPFGAPSAMGLNLGGIFGNENIRLSSDGASDWFAVWQYSGPCCGTVVGQDFNLLVSRSTDLGRNWTAPLTVNGNAALNGPDDLSQDVVRASAGTWLAVWQSTDTLMGTLDDDNDILIARSFDTGVSWTFPVPLHASLASDVGEDLDPRLATDGAGTAIAVWASTDSLGGTIDTDSDILFSVSSDSGATWSAPAALHSNATTDTGEDVSPHIATDGAGSWVAVWMSDDPLGAGLGPDDDLVVSRSTDAGATWSPPVALNDNAPVDSGDDFAPQLTADGAGNWLALWGSDDSLAGTIGNDFDVLFARSVDAGVSWTSPAPLDVNASLDTGFDLPGDIATDGLGNWVAVWESTGDISASVGADADIKVASSTDGGASWTPAFVLDLGAVFDGIGDSDWSPRITTDRLGNWMVMWSVFADFVVTTATGPDPDLDGLADAAEVNVYGTDRFDDDTDDDGILDGNEVFAGGGGGAAAAAAGPGASNTDPLNPDTDGDGLLDGMEIGLTAPQGTGTNLAIFVPDSDPGTTTDPALADSDGDGLDDGVEDADSDGRLDPGETDAANPDTDGDGHSDGDEVAAGSDPNDPNSVPPIVVPGLGVMGLLGLIALVTGVGLRETSRGDGANPGAPRVQ